MVYQLFALLLVTCAFSLALYAVDLVGRWLAAETPQEAIAEEAGSQWHAPRRLRRAA